jgi:hypothetical protein
MTTTPFDPLAEIQTYMITNSGTYALTLDGAQGGNVAGGGAGGLGAAVSGDIYLTAGTMLEIVVGGEGGAGEHYNYAAGGGGGSFVFEGSDPTDLLNDVLLAAAGGGGGGGGGSHRGLNRARFINTRYGAIKAACQVAMHYSILVGGGCWAPVYLAPTGH